MSQFGLQVMFAGFGANLYFLELKCRLFFFGLLQFFGLFVFKTPVIHNFANRRIRIGRNFYKVKTKIGSNSQSFIDWNDANLLSVRINYPDFFCPDISVFSSSIFGWSR